MSHSLAIEGVGSYLGHKVLWVVIRRLMGGDIDANDLLERQMTAVLHVLG